MSVSGFYSKGLIIEFFIYLEFRIFLIVIMLISLSLIVIYLLRLYYYLFFIKNINFLSIGRLNEQKLINIFRMLLVSIS